MCYVSACADPFESKRTMRAARGHAGYGMGRSQGGRRVGGVCLIDQRSQSKSFWLKEVKAVKNWLATVDNFRK